MLRTKIRLLLKSLQQDFGILKPKIAVLGLNPHAGENGLIGREEGDVITPVVRQFEHDGHLVFGPYPADGYFGTGQFRQFDATLSIYHDQGLIPFKLMAFEQGVNFTAGLPVVRTSPTTARPTTSRASFAPMPRRFGRPCSWPATWCAPAASARPTRARRGIVCHCEHVAHQARTRQSHPHDTRVSRSSIVRVRLPRPCLMRNMLCNDRTICAESYYNSA
ncbi:MAG: 4-hydroxythreonine-4-phosphate dehydrogenase PdxA [Hymenobacter sp.]